MLLTLLQKGLSNTFENCNIQVILVSQHGDWSKKREYLNDVKFVEKTPSDMQVIHHQVEKKNLTSAPPSANISKILSLDLRDNLIYL